MMELPDLSSHEGQQLLVPTVIALGAAGATAVLSFSHADLFRPYFGRLHPLPTVLLIGLLGFITLRVLSLRWKFKLYAGRESVKGAIQASRLTTLFAVVMILVDWRLRLPYSHIPLPQSLLFYPVMAFVAEVIFHALPLTILLGALTSQGKAKDSERLIWFCMILSSCLEPIFQVSKSASETGLELTDVYVGLHVFAFNLFQLHLFRRYDLVSMFVCRLVYYLYWHVMWGSARLYLLPA